MSASHCMPFVSVLAVLITAGAATAPSVPEELAGAPDVGAAEAPPAPADPVPAVKPHAKPAPDRAVEPASPLPEPAATPAPEPQGVPVEGPEELPELPDLEGLIARASPAPARRSGREPGELAGAHEPAEPAA